MLQPFFHFNTQTLGIRFLLEAHDKVVGIANQSRLTVAALKIFPGKPEVEGVVKIDVGEQRAGSTGNNRAKSRVKWGLRIDRGCLRPGFHGRPDTYVSLFLDVEVVFSTYKERKQ